MQPLPEKNVFEAILARRSVRSYTPRALEETTLHTLLEAAVHAPTAMHTEPWAFVIVQDRLLLKQLSDQAKPLFIEEVRHATPGGNRHVLDTFASPDFNIFYNAGVLVVICAPASLPFAAADCWLAAENLMLAACAMGLGSCVIGAALPALGMAETKRQLGIPEDFAAFAPVIVGYPDADTPPTPRKEPYILARRDLYT